MGYAAAEVAPVVARLREMMLASTRIFADETVVPVLDPGRGRTKQGYFWAIARDDRPWGGSQPPAVVYSYAPGRGHIHANTLLGGYRGILQCDGYAAYKKFAGSKSAGTSVTLAFCWSHVRRGFYDLAKAKAPIAMEALQRIAALYEIEARVRGKSAADRLAVRQAESKPLVTELRIWFEAQIAKLPARGPTAEAIRYALNHWDGLERFLDDGRIELDNNSVERAMRPVCLSRKNSLFAGSDEGGENWACLASLIETCKLKSRQSAGVFHRSPDTPRERLASETHRRTDAVALDARAPTLSQPQMLQGRGAPLTIDQIEILMDSAADGTADRKTKGMFCNLADFGVNGRIGEEVRLPRGPRYFRHSRVPTARRRRRSAKRR